MKLPLICILFSLASPAFVMASCGTSSINGSTTVTLNGNTYTAHYPSANAQGGSQAEVTAPSTIEVGFYWSYHDDTGSGTTGQNPTKIIDQRINEAGSVSYPGGIGTIEAGDGQAAGQTYVCATVWALGSDPVDPSYCPNPGHGSHYSAQCTLWKDTAGPTCDATDVQIVYGDLSPSEFNGSTKSAQTRVVCNGGDATVYVTFSGSTVNLSNGGTASLSSSATSARPVTVADGSSAQVTVTSVLHGTPSVGSFSGSSPLIVNIQ